MYIFIFLLIFRIFFVFWGFCFVFERGSGWPWTHDPPTSISWVLELQAYYLESWSPGLNTNTQITRAGFWGKENDLLFIRQRGGQGESTFQSSVVPLLRENVPLLKGKSGAQLQYMTKCMSQHGCWPWFSRCPGATSLKLYVLTDRFTSLVVRERWGVEDCLV
jgi:hypothetical protein